MMSFFEYSCYYLFRFLMKKGKSYDTAKTAAVLYISASLFFFFLSITLFLRFVDFKSEKLIFKSIGLIIAFIFYGFFYSKIEKDSKFEKIVERYGNIGSEPYPKIAVWSLVLGGIVCFCLSIAVIAIISRK